MNNSVLDYIYNTQTKKVKRVYKKWYSVHLQRDMELLVFGDSGKPILFFPTRTARFYDYENWGVIEAMESKIMSGEVQVYCIDSVDKESFYCKDIHPAERIKRHLLFEKYLLEELVPFIREQNVNPDLISAGCSLGGYHAVNFAFRHPHLFKKVIALSGRYDLTIQLEFFDDLFEGYWNEEIYFNMPSQYILQPCNEELIKSLLHLEIILAIGIEDAFLENNLQFSKTLSEKNVPHTLNLLDGEAHKAKYWGELMKIYL